MADRKGKARAWSAARARATWEREFPFAHMCDMRTCEAHLAKAYLAGIKAAHDESGVVFGGTGNREEWLEVFHHAESVRLGMSPQAKRNGASLAVHRSMKCLGFHCAQGGECPACDEARLKDRQKQAKRKGKSGEGQK